MSIETAFWVFVFSVSIFVLGVTLWAVGMIVFQTYKQTNRNWWRS